MLFVVAAVYVAIFIIIIIIFSLSFDSSFFVVVCLIFSFAFFSVVNEFASTANFKCEKLCAHTNTHTHNTVSLLLLCMRETDRTFLSRFLTSNPFLVYGVRFLCFFFFFCCSNDG